MSLYTEVLKERLAPIIKDKITNGNAQAGGVGAMSKKRSSAPTSSSKISKILKPQPAPAPGNFDNVNTPQPAQGNFDNVNTQQATPAPEVASQGMTGTFLTDPEKADPYNHLKRSRSVLGQLNTKLGGR